MRALTKESDIDRADPRRRHRRRRRRRHDRRQRAEEGGPLGRGARGARPRRGAPVDRRRRRRHARDRRPVGLARSGRPQGDRSPSSGLETYQPLPRGRLASTSAATANSPASPARSSRSRPRPRRRSSGSSRCSTGSSRRSTPTSPWEHLDARGAGLASRSRRGSRTQTHDQEARDNIAPSSPAPCCTKPALRVPPRCRRSLMAASAGSFSHLVDADFILDERVVGGLQQVSPAAGRAAGRRRLPRAAGHRPCSGAMTASRCVIDDGMTVRARFVDPRRTRRTCIRDRRS